MTDRPLNATTPPAALSAAAARRQARYEACDRVVYGYIRAFRAAPAPEFPLR